VPEARGADHCGHRNRYDATAADVKDKVAMVQQLHSEGKHAESEKLGKELLEKLK